MIVLLLCPAVARAEVTLPQAEVNEPITITAQAGNRWQRGAYEVWLLRGNCRIVQGAAAAESNEAVLWIDREANQAGRGKIIAYLEGDATIDPNQNAQATRLTDKTWLGRFHTNGEIRVDAVRVAGEPDVKPGIYQRAVERRTPAPTDAIRRTQFITATDGPPTPKSLLSDTRRIRVFPRSNVPVQAQWFPDPHSDQWIAIVDSGVNMIVDGGKDVGSIDVSTDRLVIWTNGAEEPDLSGKTLQDEEIPLEIYMEGNIIFRQGDRVIYAKRMYYDVTNKVGTVIQAEILTPVQSYEGLLRLRAEVIRQTSPDRFFAENAYITSSRMGKPGYRIESGEIFFEDIQTPAFDPLSGEPLRDPVTHEPIIEHERTATASNNLLYIDDVPIFYWPTLATNLEDPTFYLRRARIKNDQVYGTQILTNWDAFQLLGYNDPPEGTDWDLSLDYLGRRGFGHGTTVMYDRDQFFGVPGPTAGLADFWGIGDHGTDNLGRGRRNLPPEQSYRYKLFWQHRQQLAGGLQLSAEVGWISDRNFLEEYFESEWDQLKDQTTGVELKRIVDNSSWSVTADVRLNEFFTQTDWLPRVDHFWLGQGVFRDVFTWYEHSHAGYGRLRTADPPKDPLDSPWSPLPWEVPAEGERLVTRQEIDLPLQFGPVKVVPYALGELAHWGEDMTGEDLQRFYYQTGVRASMPMWQVDPTVESPIFNVHGLAHKVVFDAELSFAESNRDMMTQLPLYDPLDDDSVEAFRRRFSTLTFGGPPIPPQFDSRSYALRTGLGGWVTSPATEVADDMTALRMGIRQRWQTKRGVPGNRRIIDWVVLDTHATWFPDASDDNFDEPIGLVDYDFRWHVGDRLTLLSDGMFDFFPGGQQVITFGGYLNRPPRGSVYVGLRILEGPIENHVLSMSYSYRMSPKWVSSFGMSMDLGGEGNIGQRFELTRIGESLLISAGFTVDAARDNFGVTLAIEPRFLPSGRLGHVSGARIPVAGAFGLE